MASRSVLFGNEVCDVAVSKYHQGLPASVIEARVGEVLATIDFMRISLGEGISISSIR